MEVLIDELFKLVMDRKLLFFAALFMESQPAAGAIMLVFHGRFDSR
jgi:hypothetical protein